MARALLGRIPTTGKMGVIVDEKHRLAALIKNAPLKESEPNSADHYDWTNLRL